MPESLIGHIIGGCEIIRILDQGGMSTIYLAHQQSIGREVAIKVLSRALLGDPAFMQRFSREVSTTAKLQHPHIIPIYDHGQYEGMPYIVMAYMPGGSLKDRLATEKLPLSEVARLFEDVCQALDYAHSNGVIHRDIKPANILMDRQGNAILSDFGIARVVQEAQEHTSSGIVGTLSYIAPEMIDATQPITATADVYGLGVTLYQVLTGELPFKGTSLLDLVWAHANEQAPSVTAKRPDLPSAIDAIVLRAMAKQPESRYASAGELAADLRAVATDHELSATLSIQPASLEEAVRRVIDQVVKVLRPDGGTGSGFYLPDDRIMTALHVVDGAPGLAVQFRTGEQIEADVMAAGRRMDLALLKLRTTPTTLNATHLNGLSMERPSPKPGEVLAAIGHPLGLDWSVTGGHYNGIRMPGEEPLPRFGITLGVPLVQVDVTINPGNSGGPIIDSAARLVGVAVSIINPAVANNIGFAIAASAVWDFWEAHRYDSEPLLPYSNGHHYPPGTTYDPDTGKPIKPVNRVSMAGIDGPGQACSNCRNVYDADLDFCPYCGKPNPRQPERSAPPDEQSTVVAAFTCTNCGFIYATNLPHCPRCGKKRHRGIA